MTGLTPERYRRFVLDQMTTLLTEANGMIPTTRSVRIFLISVYACATTSLASNALQGIVDIIANDEWEFEGFGPLAEQMLGDDDGEQAIHHDTN